MKKGDHTVFQCISVTSNFDVSNFEPQPYQASISFHWARRQMACLKKWWLFQTPLTKRTPKSTIHQGRLGHQDYYWWFRNPAPPGTHKNFVNNGISTTFPQLVSWPDFERTINSHHTSHAEGVFGVCDLCSRGLVLNRTGVCPGHDVSQQHGRNVPFRRIASVMALFNNVFKRCCMVIFQRLFFLGCWKDYLLVVAGIFFSSHTW